MINMSKEIYIITAMTGEYFGLRIRLDGEAKIGDSWYDIH